MIRERINFYKILMVSGGLQFDTPELKHIGHYKVRN